jgi:pseudouridine-5'-phosphate glycosidase
MSTSVPFDVRPEIREALDAGTPIVALESALITHGFAHPDNVTITRRMAQAIREAGAVPAVVGVWRGRATVGLSSAQVAEMASAAQAVKVSVRDLPLAGVRGVHGGTTVAATSLLAHRAGLRVFATGGIGGVHRGHPEDVSADLPVLAATPIVVVCAGAKSILDLPRTLEYLETWGVPVVGWRTETFPAFYSRTSGLPVDQRVEGAEAVACIFRDQRGLRLPGGLLVTVPVPKADAVPAEEVEPLIAQAVAEAEAQGVTGKDITPFILARMVKLSSSRTQRANESLLVNNARVAAQIAAGIAAGARW